MQLIKTISICFLFVLFTNGISAQLLDFEWAVGFGGSENDFGMSNAVDDSGNIYTVGHFKNTVDFDPGPGESHLTSTGSGADGYIQKLDPDGNLVWVKQIGGIAYGMALDASGNIFVTGRFTDTADFDPGTGVTNLISNGSADVFVLKLDPNGEFLWAKSFGDTQFDRGIAVTADPSGNIYTTGIFWETVDFDPGAGTTNLTSNGQGDLFIQKLDPDGNFLWAVSMGEWGGDECRSMDTDSDGNLYAAGHFYATVDFDPGPGTVNLTSDSGPADIFILKLDPDGNFVWVKQMGGINSDFVESIKLDDAGNIYTTGNFEEVANFNAGPSEDSLTAAHGDDMFVHKMDANGDFVWVKQISGSAGDESGKSLDVDDLGNVYVTGDFEAIVDFDPGSETFYLNAGAALVEDMFVLKLDSNGDFVWAHQLGGSSDDSAESIVIDDSYNIYTTGYFLSDPAEFDPITGTTNLSPVNYYDVFIQKMSQCIPLPPSPDISNLPDLTDACSVSAPTAPTASSNCYGSITGTTTTSFPITTQGTTEVTWTYEDGSGNIITQNQNVIIDDASNPVPNVSSLPTLNDQCSVTPTPPTATDNCAGSITGTTTTSFPITAEGTTTVTQTFDDGNGNTTTQSQDIIINDVTNPSASNPSAISVCPGNIPPPDESVVTDEADNCGTPTVSFVSEVSDGNTCPETITRTYAVTDDAGNSINVTQLITVGDMTAPVPDVSSLPNESYECEANPTYPTATDNCSGNITGVPDVSFPITTLGVTNVTWTYTDNCGNSSTQSYQITVNAINVSVSLSGATLSSNASGQQYQWVDCDNNHAVIAGETNQDFTPSSNGNYAVIVTGASCSDTSLCYTIDEVGLNEIIGSEINMYPNPTNSEINIDLGTEYEGATFISIRNTIGQVLHEEEMTGKQKTLDLKHLSSGAYLVKIENDKTHSLLKLIKE